MYNYIVAVREPGVIVNISGEELPPPIPPLLYGIGFYMLAKKGPFKPSYIHSGNYLQKYSGIISDVDRDLTFILPKSGVYGMLLPSLGLFAAAPIFVIDTTSTNNRNISNILSNGLIQDDYRETAWLPTWLNGPPKKIAIYENVQISYSSNPPLYGKKFEKIAVAAIGSDNYTFYHDYVDSSTSRFDPNSQDSRFFRCAYYEEDGSFILYFALSNYDNNIVFFFKKISVNNNLVTYRVFVYTDDENQSLDNINLTITGIDDINDAVSTTILNNQADVLLEQFSAVYFYPYRNNSSLEINNNPNYPTNSANPYKITYTLGSNTTEYELSISPLDTGYYGFYLTDDFEIILSGDPYSFLIDNPNSIVTFLENAATGGFISNIYFSDRRHEGVAVFRNTPPPPTMPTATSDFLDENVISSILSSTTPFAGRAQFNNTDYLWFRHVTKEYNQFVHAGAYNIYVNWLNSWHDAILYNQDDVQPFLQAPIEVDYLTDYSANISLAFTMFIRSHNKFLFKIIGSPNLIRTPLTNRFDLVNQYFGLFDLQGYHYIRLQGHSTTFLSPSAVYLNAVLDYDYSPLFGINATLSVTDVDHEFRLSQRETLLEKNVNAIVKDRTLSVWYFNNNLTEEPRRDDSPLGEESNARVAIRLAKLLGVFVERYIGEPNTIVTRERVRNEISSFIRGFTTEFPSGIVDFRVICDETNNPPPVIANNELVIRVELRFTRSIKYVVVFERVLMAQ